MSTNSSDASDADRIIRAIVGKLEANRQIVLKSRGRGRINWRTNSDGTIEVHFEPVL